MKIVHKWQPIADLPDDPSGLTDGELRSLQRVWQAQNKQLMDQTALEEFDRRLRREWAIETGIIEDVYTLDRGVTRTLIEKGIDAAFIPHDASNRDSTLVAQLIQDHYDALDGMFDFVAGRRQLSTSYVKELHSALLRNVDAHVVVDQFGKAFEKLLEKGKYKTAPNSPTRQDGSVHEYCPPEHVDSEMDALIGMSLDHESREIPPEIGAAWLHHRFTQIHPFSDGNGRVARAIASLVFIRAGLFPLVIKREDKVRYIEALEAGDEGDLAPLISLFVETQRNALMQATEVAYDVRPIESTHEAVLAARDRLLQRGRLPLQDWTAVKDVAARLADLAVQKLESVASELAAEIGALSKGYKFSVMPLPLEDDFWREQAILKAGQIPQFTEYNFLVELLLLTDTSVRLNLSFHAIGPRFRGLIGVVPFLTIGGEAELIDAMTFQINYEEDLPSAAARFLAWLDKVVVRGLNLWRQTL